MVNDTCFLFLLLTEVCSLCLFSSPQAGFPGAMKSMSQGGNTQRERKNTAPKHLALTPPPQSSATLLGMGLQKPFGGKGGPAARSLAWDSGAMPSSTTASLLALGEVPVSLCFGSPSVPWEGQHCPTSQDKQTKGCEVLRQYGRGGRTST